MRIRIIAIGIWALASSLLWEPRNAWADDEPLDPSQYTELLEAAGRAQSALRTAPEAERSERLQAAIVAHNDLLDWLLRFVRDPAYAELDAETRGLVEHDVETGTVSLARLLAEAGDCEAAMGPVDRALARAPDTAARDRLRQTAGQLNGCPPQAWMVLDVAPAESRAWLDGTSISPLDDTLRASAGHHRLRIEADGYEPVEMGLELEAGTETQVGPIVLLPSEERWVERVAPEEWALWGAGAVLMGVGIGYLVHAGNREAEINEIEERGGILIDPAGEEDIIRDLRLVGGISLTLGIVAAATGTTLHLLRNTRGDDPAASGPEVQVDGGPSGGMLRLEWRF